MAVVGPGMIFTAGLIALLVWGFPKIIEAVNYASDSYWGNPERFKFRARIDNYTTNVTVNQGQERVVKSDFNIKMYGYIIPEVINKSLKSIKNPINTIILSPKDVATSIRS